MGDRNRHDERSAGHVHEPEAVDVEADTGERFDPFCHTLDSGGQALCFADIRGRNVHTRKLPATSTAMTVLTCQRCRKVICPTCQEIEARLAHG